MLTDKLVKDMAGEHNNCLLILLYHGVTNGGSVGIENFSGKHIQTEEFQRQMGIVAQTCVPLSMDDIVEIHRSGEEYPPRAVAVTFDDGFFNNHSNAAPILDDFKVPATFYVCAGMISSKKMFWVDELEDCFNRSLKTEVTIKLDDCPILFPLVDKQSRLLALQEVKSFCKLSDLGTRNQVLTAVREETAVTPTCDASPNYRKATWEQLEEMANNNLFTIGGHTLYHDIMTSVPTVSMEKDVKQTLRLLDIKLDQKTNHFSYPEGQEEHFNSKVIDTLKANGVVCSPTALPGVNPIEIDLFNLRRIMPLFMGNRFPLDQENQ